MRLSRWVVSLTGAAVLSLALFVGWSVARPTATAAPAASIKVGLITKTDTNPFFVKMKVGAQKAAAKNGVKLMTAAGKYDGDNASQVTAINNMVAAGAKGILLVPSNTTAIVPVVQKARNQGVKVITLDTPLQPHAPPQNAAGSTSRRAIR